MGAIFFIYTATISLGLMARLIFSDCGNAVTNPRYPTCPINLTIAIDFSTAMENETNIENLLNFVLVNFTNRLPFNDSKFYISLLSFGTKNGIKIYDYVQSYEEFCGQVDKELENLKSNGSVEVRLYDVLLKYWEFISNGQDTNKIKCDSPIACTNKLALFTAISDVANMNESANISDVINSYGRIAAVGINQPLNNNLFRIGWLTYGRVLFDNYNLWPENPLEPFLNTFLCTMNVKNSGDYRKCGEAYCDEVPCSYHGERSCYFLAGCVNGHCLYWDMLAYYRDDAQSQCQNINSTLVVVYDKTFQEGLYKIAGDFEYWIDLTPTDSNSNWKWSDVNLTLEQTSYTNWANNTTSTPTEIDLCVTDTNSKNLVRGWKVVPCNGTFELDNMPLGFFRPYICSKAASPLPNTDTTPSDTNHMFLIITICALFIASLILLFILFAIARHYYQKYKEKQNFIHNERHFYIDLSSNNLSNGVFKNNLKKLLEDENVNTITFSSDPQEKYDFNILDLDESGTIEANTRHLVRKFLHKPSGKIMAIKYLRIPHSRNDDEAMDLQFKIIEREIESIRILSENPNIIDFYGLCIHQGLALLCMELMDLSLRGLYRLVYKEEDSLFPEKIVGCVFVKIIDALIFCKSKGIMHRDIKPSNILINYSGEIKLCDFGESRIVENSVASTQAGTLAYWPPERFSHGFKYDVRGDIWSLGITLMETILGQLPYLKIHQTASNEAGEAVNFESVFILHQLLCNADFIKIIDDYIRPDYSDDFCETLNLCTQKVKERPKPDQLMMTRFYEQYVNVHSFEIATEIAKFKK